MLVEKRYGPVTLRFEVQPGEGKKKKRKKHLGGRKKWHCWYCGERMNHIVGDPLQTTTDHQTPLCRGGKAAPENTVRACRECNLLKGNMTLEEFRSEMQRMVGESIFYGEENPERVSYTKKVSHSFPRPKLFNTPRFISC